MIYRTAGIILGVLTAGVLPNPRAQAVELKGRLTSDAYIYEEDGESHFRPYERLRADLTAWREADNRSLLFHTYLRWTSDLAHKRATDPQTYVYDTYVKLTGIPEGATFSLGRQFVYTSAGSSLLDGIRSRFQPVRRIQVDIFGGSNVSALDPEKIQPFADFAVIGSRVSFQVKTSSRLGLNWMLRRSEGSTTLHRGAVDGETSITGARLYGRLAYNLADMRVAELLMRASYARSKWIVSGEFDWREPSVSSNSLFSLIDFHRYQVFRLDLQRSVWRQLAAVAQLHLGIFKDDNSWRTAFGLRAGAYSVLWQHQQGYGGQNDAMVGYCNVRLTTQWECFASANMGRYRVQDEQDDRSDAYAANLGVRWRPGMGLIFQAEGQYLRNAVQSRDIRGNLRISKDFSLGKDMGNGVL